MNKTIFRKIVSILSVIMGCLLFVLGLIEVDGDPITAFLSSLPAWLVFIFFHYTNPETQKKIDYEYLNNGVGKCPNCGSFKTRKMFSFERGWVDGGPLGTVGKQYICEDCKHMW